MQEGFEEACAGGVGGGDGGLLGGRRADNGMRSIDLGYYCGALTRQERRDRQWKRLELGSLDTPIAVKSVECFLE